MKLTKAQVQKSIHHQTISGQTIYYSYVAKCQATISMFKNQRLLIFNTNTGMLYYVNEPKQLPFKIEVPKPKNQCANLNVSMAKSPPDSNQLKVQFAMKNQKGQQTNFQWDFVLQNKTLAKEWLKVIQDYKTRRIQQVMEQQKRVQQQKNKTTVNDKTNNAFIHDTLGYGLMRGSKKQESKIQPIQNTSPSKKPENLKKSQLNVPTQPKKPGDLKKSQVNILTQPKKPLQQSKVQPNQKGAQGGTRLAESKLINSAQKSQPQKLSPQKPVTLQSNVSIREQNIRNSNNNQKHPNVNNEPLNKNKVAEQSPIRRSNVINSNNLNPGGSQVRRSQLNKEENENGRSKITLRDQLQSILQRSQVRQSIFSQIGANQDSRVSIDKSYKPQNDWNLKFLRNQNQQVLLDFEVSARKAFDSVLAQNQKSGQPISVYLKGQLIVTVTDARSIQAKKIKSEFRNYHFIMESCKYQFIVGVPLACLIQFEGLVALVKSKLPDKALKIQLTQQVMLDLKDLQRYTRIKNSVLKKAALFDLSQIYQLNGKRLIYINQLIEYLPVHMQQSFLGGSLRPEHILDNVNQLMQGGMAHQANRHDIKILNQTLALIKVNVKEMAKQLSTQDILFANSKELKDIMHQRGINLKYLPMLYTEVTNKSVKKYINTIMVAKVAKDEILQNVASLRKNGGRVSIKNTVEDSIRLLVQGNTNVSSQLWKQIAINFRKQYNIPMSNHDILGPFFLNCLMCLIPGRYDLSKVDANKCFLKDEGIISKGFVAQLLPKVKSYYRYTTQLTQKIWLTCRQQKVKQNYEAMVEQLQLSSRGIPRAFQLSRTDQLLKQYLGFYSSPGQFQPKSFPHLKLFEAVGQQPPTCLSLATTKNYLDWCLEYQQFDGFKKVLQQTLSMIDFWLDPNHVFHCQFYECLSNYYQLTGAVQQSISFMKESLTTCVRSGGVTSKKTGHKYYELAEKQLRSGRKDDSMDNFTKAKNNMENYNDQTIKYPITLMKLSSLHLNSSQFQECVSYAKLSVQKFQQLQGKSNKLLTSKGYYDQYCIKAIQIMTRAFQIQNKKAQFYRVAQLASAKYNKTKSPVVFQQLIKMCLTATILKHNVQKCQIFQSIIQKLINTQQPQDLSSQRSLAQLMLLAEQANVMQRFMFKFQSLERIAADINSRRPLSQENKDFVSVLRNIVGAIGDDYVLGLIQQKELQ